jgi:hypothetical protein
MRCEPDQRTAEQARAPGDQHSPHGQSRNVVTRRFSASACTSASTST